MLDGKYFGKIRLSEYLIWGFPPGENEQKLLVTSYNSEVITSKEMAESLARNLENTHKCTNVTIQKIQF